MEVQCLGLQRGGAFTHNGTLHGLALSYIATWWMQSFGVLMFTLAWCLLTIPTLGGSLVAQHWLRLHGVVIVGCNYTCGAHGWELVAKGLQLGNASMAMRGVWVGLGRQWVGV